VLLTVILSFSFCPKTAFADRPTPDASTIENHEGPLTPHAVAGMTMMNGPVFTAIIHYQIHPTEN
jgi:hypothetical protein